MSLHPPVPPLRLLAFAAASLLVACASGAGTGALRSGQQASVDGRIVSVDTTPWTYDGSAVVKISPGPGASDIDVLLPARWNLCQATPPKDVPSLRAGDGVQVTGTVSEDGALVVCERAQHHLRRAP